MIKVSIVITSYNNSHNLVRCLEALVNQDYDAVNIRLEIIMVDSGSTDNSSEILKKYEDKLKLVMNPLGLPRLGPAVARNTGVGVATGDILIFSDSDCVPSSDWVQNMVENFRDKEVDCVIGNREPDFGEGWGTFVRRYNFILYSNKFVITEPKIINRESLQAGEPLVLMAANNFAIKRSVWEEFGGMKTIFKNPSGEDLLLENEIIKAGYNILFDPRIKVLHFHPLSLTNMIRKAFYRGEGDYLMNKHSDGYVDWRCIVDRGDMFEPKTFCLGVLLCLLILSVAISWKMPLLTTAAVLFFSSCAAALSELIREKNKLDSIFALKGEAYRTTYDISLPKLFLFSQIQFLLRTTNSINFFWCYISKK